MAWLERTDAADTLDSIIFYLQINGSMKNVLIFRNKKRSRSNSWLVGILLTNWEKNLRREEKENFIRKRVLTSKGEKHTKENIITNQAAKDEDFLEKLLIVLQEK